MQLTKLQQQFINDVLKAKNEQKIIVATYYKALNEIKIYSFNALLLKLEPIQNLANIIENFSDIEISTYIVI